MEVSDDVEMSDATAAPFLQSAPPSIGLPPSSSPLVTSSTTCFTQNSAGQASSSTETEQHNNVFKFGAPSSTFNNFKKPFSFKKPFTKLKTSISKSTEKSPFSFQMFNHFRLQKKSAEESCHAGSSSRTFNKTFLDQCPNGSRVPPVVAHQRDRLGHSVNGVNSTGHRTCHGVTNGVTDRTIHGVTNGATPMSLGEGDMTHHRSHHGADNLSVGFA